jgi:hypothetical protein
VKQVKIAAQEGLQVINREILDDVFRQEKWTAQMTLETDRAIEFGRHLGADAVLTGYILNLDSMLSLFRSYYRRRASLRCSLDTDFVT